MSDNKIKVGITIGDVNGIGPEVLIKAFSDSQMSEMCIPVIYGSGKALAYYKKGIHDADNFQFSAVNSPAEARPKKLSLIECVGEDIVIEPGIPTPASGKAAVQSLHAAVKDLREGKIDVLVTAPINKENVQGPDFNYTGHTEFLAAELGGQPLMMMCSDMMKVGLATIHIPISQVAGKLAKDDIVAMLGRLRQSLIADFGVVEPRIAVLALNPHAGDGGLLGTEEKDIIQPAVVEANQSGVLAFGPFAADGFFAAMGYGKFDAILAMYHDQGLVPFKALTPDGVNFTAGLDYVRTSPDHGTAFDIAGRDAADPASMRRAIYMAIDIWHARRRYAEMTKNPLQHYERERAGKDLSVRDLIPEVEAED